MKRKIIGVTVGTTISPQMMKDKLKPVLSINGTKPDNGGNVIVNAVSTEEVKALINDALGVIENGTY